MDPVPNTHNKLLLILIVYIITITILVVSGTFLHDHLGFYRKVENVIEKYYDASTKALEVKVSVSHHVKNTIQVQCKIVS